MSERDLLDEILEARGHQAPPPGSVTVRDYVQRARARGVQLSETAALSTLKAEMEAGRLRGGKFTTGDSRRSRWHFWAVDGAG